MLLRLSTLERIFAGEIDTAFRRQRRPTVKAGGTLRTPRGLLDILEVEPVDVDEITPDDARRAGFDAVADLVHALADRDDARVYRVRLRPADGPDPRELLRADDVLDEASLAALRARLGRLDDHGAHGPWTRQFLRLIAERPQVRAPDLAASIGWETAPFKLNVRKLKALGLTISHPVGYELSPRGRAALGGIDGG
ncbi:MAG: hypothetical protein KDB63_17365 [Nocardioidaceae bacterium]|nr:hypothetical protein [Nocardioidaceae bacterium]